MVFINESNQKKCVVVWCGMHQPPAYMDVTKGISSINDPELAKMSKDLESWITSTKAASPADFSKAAVEIANKSGWECIWNYTQGLDAAPDEMKSIKECDKNSQLIDGESTEAECVVMQEDYSAGDIEDFIGNKASNRRAKVVIKESGKIRTLNDIYFKDGECVIDII